MEEIVAVAVVGEEEVDLVKHDDKVVAGYLFLDAVLELGGVVALPDLFAGKCVVDLFEDFVLGVVASAGQGAGGDVVWQVVECGLYDCCFAGAAWSVEVEVVVVCSINVGECGGEGVLFLVAVDEGVGEGCWVECGLWARRPCLGHGINEMWWYKFVGDGDLCFGCHDDTKREGTFILFITGPWRTHVRRGFLTTPHPSIDPNETRCFPFLICPFFIRCLMNLFDQSRSHNADSVFRSEAALTTQPSPESIVNRKGEMQAIADTVRPLTRGKTPEDALVYGPAGTGKTTCVKHVFNQLSDETSATTVSINCWQHNTRPSFLAHLLIELGRPATRKGTPIDTLCSKLTEWLDKRHNLAIALDDFDQLSDQAAVIYDLKQISQDAHNELGLVLIANKQLSQLELNPRSQSRLSLERIHFHRYTHDELETILTERADQAFHPRRIADDVPSHIADIVGNHDGDCRKALQLLLRAGRQADRDNADTVTRKHVDQNTANQNPG